MYKKVGYSEYSMNMHAIDHENDARYQLGLPTIMPARQVDEIKRKLTYVSRGGWCHNF